jgi:hypothetical protein
MAHLHLEHIYVSALLPKYCEPAGLSHCSPAGAAAGARRRKLRRSVACGQIPDGRDPPAAAEERGVRCVAAASTASSQQDPLVDWTENISGKDVRARFDIRSTRAQNESE